MTDITVDLTTTAMLLRLCLAGAIGGLIGYERHIHHKAVGVAGMMLVAIGSAAYMLLASHLALTDPSSLGPRSARAAARYRFSGRRRDL